MTQAARSWAEEFDEHRPYPGLTHVELGSELPRLFAPITESETTTALKAYGGSDPRFNPRGWAMPAGPLPQAYLEFLLWANGGWFVNGRRAFDPLLPLQEVRGFVLNYEFPHYMPGALPFALDGGGGFYTFDLRSPRGPAPVLWTHASDLGFESARPVATSFRDCLSGRSDPAAF